ncbi:MAG: NapC/NirT family cytochrome c [Candidatus Accumulibacter sp.]|jgi:cytochrome c-type protein NapC|nr:NapC/NirT family cytochrome c [Accumulibacter sp.]
MAMPNFAAKWRRFFSAGLIAAFLLGAVAVVVFNATMDWTNTEAFCISCHDMKGNYAEYQNTIHYTSASGVRATCPDCHVPQEFVPKVVAKIKASNDLLHAVLGTVDTPEKFNARRAKMAQSEWQRMKENDSRECRNCHDSSGFDYSAQGYRAANQHTEALDTGQTCIDCHKGIAHQLPAIDQGIGTAGGIAPEIFKPAAKKE